MCLSAQKHDVMNSQFITSNTIMIFQQVVWQMNWTYISMIISPDAYGDGAAADIQSMLRTMYGICLGVLARIAPGASDDDYDLAVDKLYADTQARVVLVYLSFEFTKGFFDAVRRRVGAGWFVFLSGDCLSLTAIAAVGLEYIDLLEGSIYTVFPSVPVPDFQKYIWSLTYDQVSTSNFTVRMACISSNSMYFDQRNEQVRCVIKSGLEYFT